MKRLILLSGTVLCLICLGSGLYAQEHGSSVKPASGTFGVVTKAAKAEVTYQVSPTYPGNLLLEIQTSSPFVLNAYVVNEKGVKQMDLPSQEIVGRYSNTVDLSKLPAGKYSIKVITGTGKADNFKIAFTK